MVRACVFAVLNQDFWALWVLSLLASSSGDKEESSDKTAEVKNRVAVLEADTAALTSKMSMLENQVMGGAEVSLLATASSHLQTRQFPQL